MPVFSTDTRISIGSKQLGNLNIKEGREESARLAQSHMPRTHSARQAAYHKHYFDINKLIPSFLFSASQIKYGLFQKQARFSHLKNQLKVKS